MKSLKDLSKKRIIVYGVGVILILVIIGINIPFTTHEIYQASENISVREAYDSVSANRNHNMQKVFIAANYYVDSARCINYIYTPPTHCSVKIENADAVDSEFKVEFNISTKKRADFVKNYSIFIRAGEKNKLTFTLDDKVTRFSYFIVPPMKEGYEYINLQDPHAISNCQDIKESGKTVKYCTIKKTRKIMKLKEMKLSFLLRIFKRS